MFDYKQQVLDSRQSEHAAALVAVHRQEDALKAEEDGYREYNREFTERKMSGISVADIRRYQYGLHCIEREIDRQTRELQRLMKLAEQARENVIEAKKETASLEKLREKKQYDHYKAMKTEEERFIDEFVNNLRAETRV